MIDILINVLGTLVTYFTGKNVIKFLTWFFKPTAEEIRNKFNAYFIKKINYGSKINDDQKNENSSDVK